MFGLKLQTLGWLLLAFVLAVAGSFGVGYQQGKANQKVVYERSVMGEFFKRVDVALDLADDFAKIGHALAIKVRKIATETKETVRAGESYVASKPIEEVITPTGDLDPYLIELRACQLDEVWRELGADLPEHRLHATCPPAVPGRDERRPDRHN